MAELRAYCYLDRLQPQFASLFASACRGFLSVEGMASLFVEVVPGIEINRLTDIALKITNSRPGEMIVERVYGMLEIHSFEQEEVLHAGQMILTELGLKQEQRLAPKVLATSIINKIDPYQAVIINRNAGIRLPEHSPADSGRRRRVPAGGHTCSIFVDRSQ